jgi:hypothetical protein
MVTEGEGRDIKPESKTHPEFLINRNKLKVKLLDSPGVFDEALAIVNVDADF